MSTVETVLKMNGGGPMTARQIIEYAAHFHVTLPCSSKTPQNTVARDIALDIKEGGDWSRFRRVGPGLFRLATALEIAGATQKEERFWE